MNSTRILPIVRAWTRGLSQTAMPQAEVPSNQFTKLKAKQQKFQLDDGQPVHLKGGMMDKMLYQLTIAGTTVGVLMSIQVFLKLAVK